MEPCLFSSALPGWILVVIVLGGLGVGGFFLFREGRSRVFAEEVEVGVVTLISPQQNDVRLVSTGYVYLSRRGQAKRLVAYLRFLLPVAGFLVIGIPFVGFTYWVTQQGLHLRNIAAIHQQAWPLYALFAAILILLVFSFLDDVTPSMHLFYREKLAKAFIGMRVWNHRKLDWREPPWRIPLSFSKVNDHTADGVRLPKLVVCAAVNASDESVPLGRNAGPFTFESDYSGSPLTGYVPTRDLEVAAGIDRLCSQ